MVYSSGFVLDSIFYSLGFDILLLRWFYFIKIVLREKKQSGEAASQLDIEEALEASRYASHPYSAHRRERWVVLGNFLL
ncbi:hypothetical protein Bca101_047082 [Brassica carinata]